MYKLNEAHFILINKIVTKKEGQPFGVLCEAALSDIVKSVFETNPKDGIYLYRGFIEKAAKYGDLLAEKKAFKSCNVKTAIVAILIFLKINNIELRDYRSSLHSLADCLCGKSGSSTHDWLIDLHEKRKSGVGRGSYTPFLT